MAAIYGQVDTYNTGNLHVSIEDLVGRYDAKKFPVLQRLDGKIFKKAVDHYKYEWKEEVLRPETDTLNEPSNITSSQTSITVDTAGVFNVDDIILVDSEYMVVTAVNAAGTGLTVVRAWNSTGATHNDAAVVRRVGVAAPEGADADGPVTQGLDDLYNYTQIFEDVVQMSGTEEEAFLYRTSEGNDNASNQITKKQQELMEMLQNAVLLGVRHSDSTSKRRTMGGLKYMIETYASASNKVDLGGASSWTTESNAVLSGSGITEAQERLDNLIETLVSERSNPTAIYAGHKAIRKMMNWDAAKSRIGRNDKTRGQAVPATYLSQAGELDIVQVLGRALDDYIFVVDESQIGYKAFKNRGWFTERLAKTGDSSKWQVLGEYTMKVGTPKVHGFLHNLGL